MLHKIMCIKFCLQPLGKGKYVFDIGCEQHGDYIHIEQVITRVLLSYRCFTHLKFEYSVSMH